MYFLLHQLQNLFQEEHLKVQPQAAQAAQVAQVDRWVLMRVHMEEHLLQDYLITCLIIY